MAAPKGFKIADYNCEPDEDGAYCLATVSWSPPRLWEAGATAPVTQDDPSHCLYVRLWLPIACYPICYPKTK